MNTRLDITLDDDDFFSDDEFDLIRPKRARAESVSPSSIERIIITPIRKSPAPFLPPEIIDRVLHFVPVQDYHFRELCFINTGWTYEVQRRLFAKIIIYTIGRLEQLVEVIGGRLGGYVTSLIFTCPGLDTTVQDFTRVLPQTIIFRLFHSLPNLESLDIHLPRLPPFTLSQYELLSSTDLFPKLGRLCVYTTERVDWKSEMFDIILAGSPNLHTVELFDKYIFEEEHVPGIIRSARVWNEYPKGLKKLSTEHSGAMTGGEIFPVEAFSGLEEFVCRTASFCSRDERFFQSAGATLRKLELNALRGSSLIPFFPLLTGLVELKLNQVGSNNFFQKLPSSLKKLSIKSEQGLEMALRAGQHLAQQLDLDSLEIPTSHSPLNLTNLALIPKTKVLKIADSFLEVEISIDQLIAGREIPRFKKIILFRPELSRIRATRRSMVPTNPVPTTPRVMIGFGRGLFTRTPVFTRTYTTLGGSTMTENEMNRLERFRLEELRLAELRAEARAEEIRLEEAKVIFPSLELVRKCQRLGVLVEEATFRMESMTL